MRTTLTKKQEKELALLKSDVSMSLAQLAWTPIKINIRGTYFSQDETGTCEYVYYQDNIHRKDGTSFNKLTDRLIEILKLGKKKCDGSVMDHEQIIITPDNRVFLCLSLSSMGGAPIWRQAFEEAAQGQGLITGEIQGPVGARRIHLI